MGGAKYFVWAGGAWRELELSSGRVVGWRRRARFVLARRGRLELTRASRVLRALAAHAESQPAAVRDAARLSQRGYSHGSKPQLKTPAVCGHVCCHRAHRNSNTSCIRAVSAVEHTTSTTHCVTRADASTQVNAHKLDLNSVRRPHDTTSSDDDFQTKPGTSRTERKTRSVERVPVNRSAKIHAKNRPQRSSSEEFISAQKNVGKSVPLVKSPVKSIPTSKRREENQNSDASKVLNNKGKAGSKPAASISAQTPLKRKRVVSISSDDKADKEIATVNKSPVKARSNLAKKPRKDAKESSEGMFQKSKVIKPTKKTLDDKPLPNKTKNIFDKVISSLKSSSMTAAKIEQSVNKDTTESESNEGSAKQANCKQQPGKLKSPGKRSSSSDEALVRRVNLFNGGSGVGASSRRGACLELVIPEEDVSALRAYIRRARCADVRRFDADEDYKRALFYAINPLVDVERCERLERALRERDLRRFAARLGLRSVSDTPSPAPRRLRNRHHAKHRNSSPDTDSEHFVDMSNSKTKRNEGTGKDPPKYNFLNLSRDKSGRFLKASKSNRPKSATNSQNTSNEDNENSNKNTSAQKTGRTRDNFADTSQEINKSRPKNTNTQNGNRTRDNSETSKQLDRVTSRRLSNRLQEQKSKQTRDSAEDTATEATADRTEKLTKKPSVRESNHASDTTEDTSKEHKSIRSKKLTKRNKKREPIVVDSSEDSSSEASQSTIKKKSSTTHVGQSEHPTETRQKTSKFTRAAEERRRDSSKRNHVQKPIDTVDSSDDSSEASRDKNKKESSKINIDRSIENGQKVSKTTRRTEDRKKNLSRTKTLVKRSNVQKSIDTVDSSEDASEASRDTSRKKSSKTTIDRSERTTDANHQTSKSIRGVESRGEYKENVPQRANRLAEGHEDLSPRKEAAEKAARSSHTISKRSSSGAGKEYSNLEDHAIVAWVSSGGRARRVNGNRVWRDLQDQYQRLAGRQRTWHSLRNRYLRYILPALPALQLPPAHVSRLRAAAASGELKSKRREPRRNSIFKEPALRGAASRRPRPAPRSPAPPPPARRDDGTSEEEAGPAPPRRALRSSGAGAPAPSSPVLGARSPRYSDVTRRFAAKQLRSTPRDSVSAPRDPEPPPSPPAPAAGRSRRLFNPKAPM